MINSRTTETVGSNLYIYRTQLSLPVFQRDDRTVVPEAFAMTAILPQRNRESPIRVV